MQKSVLVEMILKKGLFDLESLILSEIDYLFYTCSEWHAQLSLSESSLSVLCNFMLKIIDTKVEFNEIFPKGDEELASAELYRE
ncbi:MAG: hypothetical protein WCF03_14285 [Nitrososphaeraceae archaeon]